MYYVDANLYRYDASEVASMENELAWKQQTTTTPKEARS